MTNVKNRLFPEFPEVTTQQWEEKITADLKGKDYEKALVWRTNEGFAVRPYYRAENLEGKETAQAAPGEFPFVRGIHSENNWLIRQDIVVTDLKEANQKALGVLNKGVNSLGFIFDYSKKLSVDDLKVLLKDICLDAAEINFVCPCGNCDVTVAFTKLITEGPWDPEKVRASMSNDPLMGLLLTGKMEGCCEDSEFMALKAKVEGAGVISGFRTIAVNGKFFGNSGSSIVQELAFSLAAGAEYLSRLTDLGMKVDEVAQKIKFNFSVSNNYFFEIAKLRAGRLLWAQIVQAYQPECECSTKMVAHCETGSFNKTVYDPYVNLLRTQTEAMSAALGGAHSITVLPFDAMLRQPGDFSDRIARNQQILLKEESNLDKITDAAGGSYYIESLTASIAEQAWKLFLQVDEKGGFLSAVKEGSIQKQVSEMAAKRDQNLALRRENLLGVNQFPNFTETMSEELDPSVFRPADFTAEEAEVETMKPYRAGQSFEALRYRTDLFSLKHKRPAAFMLTIGDLAMRKARAQFSCNFFAVAGFEVIDNNGFATVEEGLEAARAIGAEIVVVCSSDDEYAVLVPALAEKIGNEILVVAGNPACRPDLEALGVKNYIHIRSNLLKELTEFQKLVFKCDE